MGKLHKDEKNPKDSFAELVEKHLGMLKWNQQALADRAGISKQQISRWLNRTNYHQQNIIGRHNVYRIAWALVAGDKDLQKKPGETYLVDTLEATLDALLLAAGYSRDQGRQRGQIWNRLTELGGTREPLKIGWVPYPPFAEPRDDEPNNPLGLAIEITEKVMQLMGAAWTWQRCTWQDLIPKLRSREIDIVAPVFMKLPMRMFQVEFSCDIPYFIGANGVVRKEDHSKLVEENNSKRLKINSQNMLVSFLPGEVGENLWKSIASLAEKEQSLPQSAEEAYREIIDGAAVPTSRGRGKQLYRCFFADHATCKNLVRDSKSAKLLSDTPEPLGILLPLGFAVHPEELQLTSVINSCIQIMDKVGYFQNLFQEHKDWFKYYAITYPQRSKE